jgi:hypothetical protein
VKSATRRGGIKLAVKTPGAGKLTASAKSARTVRKTVKHAGTVTLKLAVKKKGKLKVKVTFKPRSGHTATKTLTINVR